MLFSLRVTLRIKYQVAAFADCSSHFTLLFHSIRCNSVSCFQLHEVLSMVSLGAIKEGALPMVEVLSMVGMENVTRIFIAPCLLVACETLVMINVAIKMEKVKDILYIEGDCLKSLTKVMVSNAGQDRGFDEEVW